MILKSNIFITILGVFMNFIKNVTLLLLICCALFTFLSFINVHFIFYAFISYFVSIVTFMIDLKKL